MFVPRWWSWQSSRLLEWQEGDMLSNNDYEKRQQQYFSDPRSWTYLYDHSPLAKTLDKYIDYKKINLAATQEESPSVLRLIITAVDIMTSRPLVFDNTQMEIKAKHILASSGYPIYGFPWIEVKDGVFAWDGSLLSNTPVR